jgi:hypothetical protein
MEYEPSLKTDLIYVNGELTHSLAHLNLRVIKMVVKTGVLV